MVVESIVEEGRCAEVKNIKASHLLYQRRRAGVLLHPTSLPGPLPQGLICHDAYRFVEFLAQSGIKVWQMLPLGPTHDDGSPYQSLSAHACDTKLISLDWLVDRKLLDSADQVDDFAQHQQCLWQAWQRFEQAPSHPLQEKFHDFMAAQLAWLPDYALFMAIREQQNGQGWLHWPTPLRDREPDAMAQAQKTLAPKIGFHCFMQFVFFEQWQALKHYAQQHGILLFGDLPIYVAHDSADVWVQRDLFLLDQAGAAKVVAGVPPDYFSETGQRWGNPQYDWAAMEENRFVWWHQRFNTQLSLFDLVRIDHFRGFQAYWEIKAEQETAVEGRWVEAPGAALLNSLKHVFSILPFVAEDLGVITEQVTALRKQFDLPGMKILQFAYDGDPANAYLPHHHCFESVVYTGTHDNDTSLSWYQQLAEQQQAVVKSYLNISDDDVMPWPLIETALASVSCLAMLPMQDILSLGQGQRMNTPGTTEGNWQWRYDWSEVPEDLSERLAGLCQQYDR